VLCAELRHRVGALEVEVAFEVPAGRCLALAGPSGAGKTSVLRLLAGTLRPTSGRVSVGDAVWIDSERGICLAPEERRCGYVYQDYALFPHLSAWRNVAYGFRGVARGERRARAVELLERFGLRTRVDARPAALSGGEQQRVAVARALGSEPALLLLDEPLSALDARSRASAAHELAAVINSLEVPAVLVTHDFAEAAQLAHEIGVIDAGRIVQQGTASQLASAPASAFVADFAGAVVLTGSAHGQAGLTVVELDGGGSVTSTDPAAGRVAVSVFPWEITVSAAEAPAPDSVQNHLRARITSVTALGNRVRVGLLAGQPLVAEVTGKAVEELGLQVGQEVTAGFKATATRVVGL
jgi:molybdate transport system ATP-binding protein